MSGSSKRKSYRNRYFYGTSNSTSALSDGISSMDSESVHSKGMDSLKRITLSKKSSSQEKLLPKPGSESSRSHSASISNISTAKRIKGGTVQFKLPDTGNITVTKTECHGAAPGPKFLLGEPDPKLTTFQVKMDSSVQARVQRSTKFTKYEDKRRVKSCGTQTLYRESSAQTLPYLPEIQDKETDENLELYKLSSILSGDGQPGLYEVEKLERARKRWAWTKALKINIRRQLHAARERLLKSKYQTVLQAFEWENWIEREEYIQECQMMRLEIVVRMFDKREREIQNASKTRLELACEKIEAEKQQKMRKNEIEYQRGVRRLQMKQAQLKQKTYKRSILDDLSSPCSEFYAPQMRHGVDPKHRHFTGGRRAFDLRIDELEKRINMKNLVCPFSKLREWSKPKEPIKEYEQNFCSDVNLQKLYDSLRGLREAAVKHKTPPKCLIKRHRETARMSDHYKHLVLDTEEIAQPKEFKQSFKPEDLLASEKYQSTIGTEIDPSRTEELLAERHQEELENMLYTYEGTTIGWIMQFLSEEMERLKEQRKLHFFSILAQKERWRREAAEAGLRQKENSMRHVYEELYQLCNLVNSNVANDFMQNIKDSDLRHNANWEAAETITATAKQIDEDIQRWLDSFRLIQTPLTYEPLRYMLRDCIFPNLAEILMRNEKVLITKYIIDDVLLPRIDCLLEPYDIVASITDEMVDRLTDNDLYYYSTDSESEPPKMDSQKEAEAIIRKVIRQAVPGRRWNTTDERVCQDNAYDILDDVFKAIEERMQCQSVLSYMEPGEVRESPSKTLIFEPLDVERMQRLSLPQGESELLYTKTLSLLKRMKNDISKPLVKKDVYCGEDHFRDTDVDEFIKMLRYKLVRRPSETLSNRLSKIRDIPSVLDIQEIDKFLQFIDTLEIEKPNSRRTSSVITDIGIIFDTDKFIEPYASDVTAERLPAKESQDIVMGILESVLPFSEAQSISLGLEEKPSLSSILRKPEQSSYISHIIPNIPQDDDSVMPEHENLQFVESLLDEVPAPKMSHSAYKVEIHTDVPLNLKDTITAARPGAASVPAHTTEGAGTGPVTTVTAAAPVVDTAEAEGVAGEGTAGGAGVAGATTGEATGAAAVGTDGGTAGETAEGAAVGVSGGPAAGAAGGAVGEAAGGASEGAAGGTAGGAAGGAAEGAAEGTGEGAGEGEGTGEGAGEEAGEGAGGGFEEGAVGGAAATGTIETTLTADTAGAEDEDFANNATAGTDVDVRSEISDQENDAPQQSPVLIENLASVHDKDHNQNYERSGSRLKIGPTVTEVIVRDKDEDNKESTSKSHQESVNASNVHLNQIGRSSEYVISEIKLPTAPLELKIPTKRTLDGKSIDTTDTKDEPKE